MYTKFSIVSYYSSYAKLPELEALFAKYDQRFHASFRDVRHEVFQIQKGEKLTQFLVYNCEDSIPKTHEARLKYSHYIVIHHDQPQKILQSLLQEIEKLSLEPAQFDLIIITDNRALIGEESKSLFRNFSYVSEADLVVVQSLISRYQSVDT